MELRPVNSTTPRPRKAPPAPGKASHPPRDGFTAAGTEDASFRKMDDLRRTSLAGAVLAKDNRELDEIIVARATAWSCPKERLTECDTVYDKERCTLFAAVAGEEHCRLTAFTAEGKTKWAYEGAPPASSPVVDGEGNVYFRVENGLVALDKDGNEKWSFPTPSRHWFDAPPAVAKDGTVYVVTGASEYVVVEEPSLRVVAVRDGKEIWHYDAYGDYTGDPQVVAGGSGTVYLSAEKSRRERSLYGLVLGDREERGYLIGLRPDGREAFARNVWSWDTYTKGNIVEGPDGAIYACHENRKLTAFTPEGKKKWTYEIEGTAKSAESGAPRFSQPPAFDRDGNVYLAASAAAGYPESYLVRLDPQGKETLRVAVEGCITSKPHIAPDGLVYVGTGDGNLLAFGPDGRRERRFAVGEMGTNNFAFGDRGEIFLNTKTAILALDPSREAPAEESTAPPVDEKPPDVTVDGEHVVIKGVKLRRAKAALRHIASQKR